MERVCVIGAGVAGLVSAKVLKQDGFDVVVYDREPTVGGVWAPSRAYRGLRTNNPRETYAFSDHRWPDDADEFPTATEVQAYLEGYAERFGLAPALRLSTEVVSVERRSGARPGYDVTVRPAGRGGGPAKRTFDRVVVCNGVFSKPYVPRLEGRDRFDGRTLHSSEVADGSALRGRRVVVVGAGKSALDCATTAAETAASCTLVFRTPHWMLPRYFFDRWRVDRILFTRFSEWLLPAYHRRTGVQRALRVVGAPLIWVWRRVMTRLIPRLVGMPAEMVPPTPVTSGAQNIGIGEAFYEAVAAGDVEPRRAALDRVTGRRSLRLDTGDEVEADVVVFATGWEQELPFLSEPLRREVRRDGRFHLFRQILPPRERRLGFVGYASSANCPLTAELSAHWLSACFRGEMQLPDAAAMDAEIERVRGWAARVFPKRDAGYFIGGYVVSHADELLRDMGLRRRRAPGLLPEYLGPLWAERYAGIREERRRLRAAG